ncbi:hypothetical protein A3H16_03190 [Candidatus Kaiserbacteria bacterium RIFCSPLOWO2_12_FULL_53_8]|uniref:DUF2207 domain-containing protein n=2 Tax=Candidatus Kaiseribacteriota TaxID=1752734 RepID=A0A1F6CVA6_9BACT|nr:MAG: hypothetical protein A2851_05785 [Candidatus Kaiserbacteria bacterium RIFCSPHIGHO2_01_FULL_53_29]OGG91063.1 MAG: hypothetical protein A3H16_03190 [Candidatus Kaiserbacteria bacterium RIFCSPLOWO2_12_FULL_53_8]
MHVLKRLMAGGAISAISMVPLFSYAQSDAASYRYNRITTDFSINADGSVDVSELLTMFYNGGFHASWRSVPHASSTPITDVRVLDGTTGRPFAFSPERLDGADSSDWNKYSVYEKDGSSNIEWYYNTSDRVHTWVLHYTLHNELTITSSGTGTFEHTLADYGVPVDTIESTVTLPGAITEPQVNLVTSTGRDFYIDRPDERTYRFRVSSIESGEQVSIHVGWQKGLVNKEATSLYQNQKYWHYILGAGLLAVLATLALLFLYWRRKEG